MIAKKVYAGEVLLFKCDILDSDKHGSGYNDMACVVNLPNSNLQYKLDTSDILNLGAVSIAAVGKQINLMMRVPKDSLVTIGKGLPSGITIKEVEDGP